MKVTQSCLTLCDPIDCSPPGSSVHGILQVRILEWVAIPFSKLSSVIPSYFPKSHFYFILFIYLAVPHLSSMLNIQLQHVGLSCGMWDLVPWPGIKLRTPALGAWSLSHWAPREVPRWCVHYPGQATSGCDRKCKRQVLLPPFYKRANWGLEMINDLLQVCAFICLPFAAETAASLPFTTQFQLVSQRDVLKKKKNSWSQMNPDGQGWKRVIINQTSWISFPRVATTKHCKLGVWEQQSCILCLFQRPEVQDQSVNRAMFLHRL